MADRRTDLAEVVRGHLGCHADGDSVRSVDEQVWDLCRENGRLLERLIVVRDERHRLLVEIIEQGLGVRGEPHFGVPARCSRIAVDRTEVALPLDEHVAVGEGLGHLDDRIVDGSIAVRVELTHHVPDHPCALLGGLVAGVAHLPHRIERTAVDRLETVTDIRDGPADDHAHRIVDVGGLHLVLDADRLDTVRPGAAGGGVVSDVKVRHLPVHDA